MRKDILEAAKAMVVARERAEDEAGAEVGPTFHFCCFTPTHKFFWGALKTVKVPPSALKYFLQVVARLARVEAALAKLLARSEPADL